MQGHGNSAVVFLGQGVHGMVFFSIDEDGVFEELTIEHGVDGQVTDQHRGNGQQQQRNGHNPRGLMGAVVMVMVIVTVMIVMAMVCIRVLVITFFAMEHQEVHAEGIEGGDKHTGQHRKVCKARAWQMAFSHGFDDAVFGIEAGKERRADQSQGTQQGGDPSDGHVLAHAAHPTDVLVVVHAHDDRSSTQEQQGFEEGVCHEVEHGHRVSRSPQGHRHVTQLRQGGVSHHALDVVLNQAQKAHEQSRDGTDHQDEVERRV